MTIGLKLGSITDELGEQDFFHSFFSTVNYRLENDGWGSRFPILLNKLYQGSLEQKYAEQAIKELSVIATELEKLSPDQVIWDIEDLKISPPWGKDISKDITDLSNYYVTSTGRDLIGVLRESLNELLEGGNTLEVVSL